MSLIVVALVVMVGVSLTPAPRVMTMRELTAAVASAPERCRARLRRTVTSMRGGVYDNQYKRIYERDCPPLTGYGWSSNGGFVTVEVPRER